MMNLSNWKEQMKERPLYGCFVTWASPTVCEFVASMGFDFTLIDNEHGVMNEETLENMVRASQAEGVPAVIRIPQGIYQYVQKSLDMGANGIQVPLVNTAEYMEQIVQLSNFPPEGKRGTAYQTRAAGYGLVKDKRAYLKKANETKFVSVQIETVEAVKNIDSILQVEGIDCCFIGPGDLSSSMQLPYGDPRVNEVIDECIVKIARAGKIPGLLVGSAEAAKHAEELGARYIVVAENNCMSTGARSFLDSVR
ncbi:MAG: HpcH/HpaI aldolase family protein [Lachnospiraceae bacterium]|jgi:2-keto-3-deoxy-L-rhamnonate aldolase RhmA